MIYDDNMVQSSVSCILIQMVSVNHRSARLESLVCLKRDSFKLLSSQHMCLHSINIKMGAVSYRDCNCVYLIVVFVCTIFVVKFWQFIEPIHGLECHSCIIKQLFLFSCLSFVIAVIWKPFGLEIYSQTSALNMKIESFKSITYTFFYIVPSCKLEFKAKIQFDVALIRHWRL